MTRPEVPQLNVLVIHEDRVGDRNNLKGLAQQLGWPYECQHYRFAKQALHDMLRQCPPRVLEVGTAPKQNPDVILVATGAAMHHAIAIRKKAARPVVVVKLGRPYLRSANVDLWVQTRQFMRFPFRKTLQMDVPFSVHHHDKGVEKELVPLPRPQIAVLIGGKSGALEWGKTVARDLGILANAEALKRKASLLISTSYRTGQAEAEAFLQQITVPHSAYVWGVTTGPNPFRDYLKSADCCWVTADSFSMIAEAHASGKPVEVMALAPVGPLDKLLRKWPNLALFGRESYLHWLHQNGYFSWHGEAATKRANAELRQTQIVDVIRQNILVSYATALRRKT